MTIFKRKRGWILIAVLVGGAAWIFLSRDKTPVTTTSNAATEQAIVGSEKSAPKPALTVTTTHPVQTGLPIQLIANGSIAAWQEASIGSESGGLRLTEVRANVGDQVRAGDVLARFAAESVEADVAQASASLSEAIANAAEATANAQRAQTLQSSGALSAQQISQYLTSEQTAKARVGAGRAMLQAQKLRLQHTRLLAPDNGIISARTATVGAVVGAGAELFRMIRQGRLEWRAEVTATELAHLKPGALAHISLANGEMITGKVRMIAPTVDPQTRVALVYVDLVGTSAKNLSAKAGMFASGRFELGRSTALTVPQQAVVIRDGFAYVFRLNSNNRVSKIRVETGRRIDDRVEVLGGIPADALIVASGAGFLNDGDVVRAVSDSASAVPSASAASIAVH
ncbi:MAG: efflux RND transporter periplasmic adaptor subunit [Thiobacillaceae bacterium]